MDNIGRADVAGASIGATSDEDLAVAAAQVFRMVDNKECDMNCAECGGWRKGCRSRLTALACHCCSAPAGEVCGTCAEWARLLSELTLRRATWGARA